MCLLLEGELVDDKNITQGLELKSKGGNILHEGRLGSYSSAAAKYTSSIDIDGRLLASVIQINAAHVIMLAEQGVIDRRYARELLGVLRKIPKDLEMKDDLEDVHMNVENFVISKIGKDARRNDEPSEESERSSRHGTKDGASGAINPPRRIDGVP